ncbi:hypothetical protein D7X87_18005 [bacterium D16-54]|nr:hypothetical protein D7X87_18005 [bacterium D16-54]RKJ13051.1 hypothetical protein D7X65_17840 [bacterium D16-56]
MRLRVNVKHVGKKKQGVEEMVCEVRGCPGTVRELILAVVDAQVSEYNRRVELAQDSGVENGVLACLTREEIGERAQGGKVGFGVNYGGRKADLEKARVNAVQCFEDGIYRVFMDGRGLEELDEGIVVSEESVFTFVRLTMLTGRMW